MVELIKEGFHDLGDYAPWVYDRDPPPKDMNEVELQKYVKGVGELIRKIPK